MFCPWHSEYCYDALQVEVFLKCAPCECVLPAEGATASTGQNQQLVKMPSNNRGGPAGSAALNKLVRFTTTHPPTWSVSGAFVWLWGLGREANPQVYCVNKHLADNVLLHMGRHVRLGEWSGEKKEVQESDPL